MSVRGQQGEGRAFKYQFDLELLKLLMEIPFPCSLEIIWKRGPNNIHTKNKIEVERRSKEIMLNQKLSMISTCHLPQPGQFDSKLSTISVVIYIGGSPKNGGSLTLDLCKILNPYSYRDTSTLLIEAQLTKCPLKNSKISVRLTATFLHQMVPEDRSVTSISSHLNMSDLITSNSLPDQRRDNPLSDKHIERMSPRKSEDIPSKDTCSVTSYGPSKYTPFRRTDDLKSHCTLNSQFDRSSKTKDDNQKVIEEQRKRSKLEAEINKLNIYIAEQGRRLHEYLTENARLTDELKKAKFEQISQAKEKQRYLIDTLQREKNQLKSYNEGLQRELSEARNGWQSCKLEVAQMQKILEEMRMQMEKMSVKNKSCEVDAECAQKENRELKRKIQEMNSQYEHARRELQTEKQARQRDWGDSKRIDQIREQMEREIREVTQAKERLERSERTLNESNRVAVQQISVLRAENQLLVREKGSWQQRIDQQFQSIRALQLQRTTLSNELMRSNSDLKEKTGELQKLRSQMSEKIGQLSQELNQEREKCRKLQQAEERAKKDNQMNAATNLGLLKEHQERNQHLQSQLKAKQAHIRTLEKDIEEKKKVEDELGMQMRLLNGKIKLLEGQIAHLENLNTGLQAYQTKTAGLEIEMKRAGSETAHWRRQQERLQIELEKVQCDNKQLRANVKQLEEDRQRSELEHRRKEEEWTNTLRQKKEEAEKYLEELRTIKKGANETEMEIHQKMVRENLQLQMEVKYLEQELNSFRERGQETEELKWSLKVLEQGNKELSETLEKAETELREKSRALTFEAEKNRLHLDERNNQNRSLATLKEQNQLLQKNHSASQNQAAHLHNQLLQLEAHLPLLHQQIEEQNIQLNHLNARVIELTAFERKAKESNSLNEQLNIQLSSVTKEYEHTQTAYNQVRNQCTRITTENCRLASELNLRTLECNRLEEEKKALERETREKLEKNDERWREQIIGAQTGRKAVEQECRAVEKRNQVMMEELHSLKKKVEDQKARSLTVLRASEDIAKCKSLEHEIFKRDEKIRKLQKELLKVEEENVKLNIRLSQIIPEF